MLTKRLPRLLTKELRSRYSLTVVVVVVAVLSDPVSDWGPKQWLFVPAVYKHHNFCTN